MENNSDIKDRIRTFKYTLDLTRIASKMSKYKLSTVHNAFQWADTISTLKTQYGEQRLSTILSDELPPEMPCVYTNTSEIATSPASVLLRAILTSDFLHFSENASAVFKESINQATQRLGLEMCSNILHECLKYKLQKRKENALDSDNLICKCASDLLHEVYQTVCIRGGGQISEIMTTIGRYASSNQITFLIVCQVILLEDIYLFSHTPLDSTTDALSNLKNVQRLFAEMMMQLLLNEPLLLHLYTKQATNEQFPLQLVYDTLKYMFNNKQNYEKLLTIIVVKEGEKTIGDEERIKYEHLKQIINRCI